MTEKPIKCIAIDDEPLALALVESYIRRNSGLEYLGGFTSPLKAQERLAQGGIELVYCDIQMPGMTGLELAKFIPEECAVVFITAYEQYALEGFRANAVDYLLKPVSFSDFSRSYNKIKRYLRPSVNANNDGKSITVRAERQDMLVMLEDILYVEALKDYMMIHTVNGNIITHSTLKQLKSQLPEELFAQVHRSFLVNKTKINAVSSTQVGLVNGKYLPVSETYRGTIRLGPALFKRL